MHLFHLVRFVLFSTLMFFRPVVTVIFSLFSGLCLFGFLFCLLFARTQTIPLWAFLGAGITSTITLWIYDAMLSFLAPDNTVLIVQR